MEAIDIEHLRVGALHRGSIEVICGSMFSGKTEELMRRLRRAVIAKMKVEVYKPATDVRYDESKVVSHDAHAIDSIPLENAQMILIYASDADVVGIDEAQFFDNVLIDVVHELADSGKRVIIAGLDMDFRRNPFGPMPQLMALADSVTKVHAVCVDCGKPANYSYRLSDDDRQVLLGELDEYRPLCRECFLHRQHK
ncbi:MAG: thymidine kinase [Bacteroidales bacterium]|nr:thymidine kinase [Porphyromonas sp.]MDD6934303.1 thymidine kinase [Bacteroidales bacterium]MDY3102033.1 thymidine kinase [Porphyromonas sp.]